MSNFVKEIKQTGYSNPARENFEMTIRQEDVRNDVLIGQFINGAQEITREAYDIASTAEKEAAKTAKEQAEARKIADYNEFARRKQQINAQAEQTGNWTAADTATRKLIDDFSRRPGVEAGKLYDLLGKTDFTGAYAREKDTRTFWNNKNNDAAYKAVEAVRTANPSVAATLSPEATHSYINSVGDSWDKGMEYLAKRNAINPNENPSEYNYYTNKMQEAIGNNIVSSTILEIFDDKGKIRSSADLELYRVKYTEKLVKEGFNRAKATILVDQSLKRSGVADLVEAANRYQTLTTEDIQRTIKYNVEMGKAEMGATKNIFSALMVSSDNWQKGEYYSDILNREVGKTWNTMLEELALTGKVTKGLGTTDADRGQIYGGAVDILKSRLSAPLKGGAVSQVFEDVTKAYNDRSAEERVQGFSEVLNKFDNAYLDVNIQQLLSSSLPEHREAGKALQKKREDLVNAKDMAVYETSNTPGADALNYLRQGPGASLLRVTNDGQLVVVDGSKGFLQSTAITLSDATGRYFGYVSDFNKEFADMFGDAETRKKMLEAGNIPALDPRTETVIGRKEWYLGTGDKHIKDVERMSQMQQPGEWDFNAVEGLGGKIWEGMKENTKGKIENTVRLGKNTKEFFTVDDVTDNSPFTKALGITPKEVPSEIEKLEKTLENEDLKPHIRRAVEGTIEILKNQDGTATARYSRSEPLGFAHMETPEVYKLTEEGTKAENKLLQSMGEHDTFLGVAEEGLYQERKKSLPKSLQSEKDYDLRGAYKAGLLDNVEEGMHLPDTFKKPNHITFSKESKYYEDGMWAGEWTEDGDFMIPLNTSKAKLAKLKNYFAEHEPNAMIVIDNPKVLKQLEAVEAEEDRISEALSTEEDMDINYAMQLEKEKEALMNKRHRLWKLVYIQP
jgi:hypothetical protein